MSKSAMIRARTESKLKSRVEKIFETLGLTASQAINLFYHRVALENGLPFEVKIPNQQTLSSMADADHKKDLREFDHVEDMLKTLKK